MSSAHRPNAEQVATRRSYDLVADRYAVEIAGELMGKPLDRALLGMLAELAGEGRIADIGCGPGHVTRYLARHSAQVIGFDLSTAMMALARRAAPLPFCAADMTTLPLASQTLHGIVCLYAVIHLDRDQRIAAYREFTRTLTPGGHALIAFHTGDPDVAMGGSTTLAQWWGFEVALTFRFLDPAEEIRLLGDAGLTVVGRIDRAPYPNVEHPSQRCYLIVQRQ